MQTLEDQFHAAMQSRKQQNEAAASAKSQAEEETTKLGDLYIQSLTAKESLRKENQRLRRLADEYYMKNQGRLRILLDSNKKVRPSRKNPSSSQPATHIYLTPSLSSLHTHRASPCSPPRSRSNPPTATNPGDQRPKQAVGSTPIHYVLRPCDPLESTVNSKGHWIFGPDLFFLASLRSGHVGLSSGFTLVVS